MNLSRTLPRLGLTALALASLGLAVGACSGTNYGTGALLSVDYFGDTDVVGFHYIVQNVSCAGEPIVPSTLEFNVDLADSIFPGQVQYIEGSLDPATRHLGADLFVSLAPGCWTVTAIPASSIDVVTGDWLPSADCQQASLTGSVEVVDGATTEAPVLISQCVGDPIGALDTTVVLNHAPAMYVSIDEKINYECETVEVCAQGYDVDDDPLEFFFEAVSSPAWDLQQGTPEVIGFEEGHRIWEQCALITTRFTNDYQFKVTVKDLDNAGQPIEDSVDGDSHDDLTFQIYTNWIEEPLCWDTGGNLVMAPDVSIVRAPGCGWTTAEQWYCSGAYDAQIPPGVTDYICDGNDLIEELLYPQCD